MATALRDLPVEAAAAAEVDAYFRAAQRKSLLRFITCGSVDDGKSTLIGRLLYDSKLLFEDQLAALADESARIGTQGNALDFALLVDGLGAEREQGITIDVAYRYFATEKRKFIVADTPGHEQFTRNMVTGASTADLAIILIDARKGVLTQTRRHAQIAVLLGIRHLVLAVNKMDLVGFDQGRFDDVVGEFRRFASGIGAQHITAIPMSGLGGDNVTRRSDRLPWYAGPSLLEHLETVPLSRSVGAAPLRMAVQWVNRPSASFRGYAGRIASGTARPGDEVTILPGGQTSRIDRIVSFGGDLDAAVAGQSVTLTLADDVDCSRGSLIVAADARPTVADRMEAILVWTGTDAMASGRPYWLKLGTQTVTATVEAIHHVIDVDDGGQAPGRPLALNDLGRATLRLDRPVPLVDFAENRELGGFLLIDKIGNATVAAGMIEAAGPAADPEALSEEPGRIVWIRGRSRAERRAAAARAQEVLQALGRPVSVLGDAVLRAGLSTDLADDADAAAEQVRRVREVAKLMAAAGVHVLVTIDAPAVEAHPGRHMEVGREDGQDPGEWVI